MHSYKLLGLAAAVWAVLHPAPGIAQPLCKPRIAVESVDFSKETNLMRLWTATLSVDASQCAASSGLFSLAFVRLAESARDLEFAEPFIWRPGRMTVRVPFWWDEAVERYWIADVAACSCRK